VKQYTEKKKKKKRKKGGTVKPTEKEDERSRPVTREGRKKREKGRTHQVGSLNVQSSTPKSCPYTENQKGKGGSMK